MMEMKIQLKLKVRILILPKCLTPHPHCIFWPQNSHFSITWFKRVIFEPFLTPCGEGSNPTKNFLLKLKDLIDTLLTRYKPLSGKLSNSSNRRLCVFLTDGQFEVSS